MFACVCVCVCMCVCVCDVCVCMYVCVHSKIYLQTLTFWVVSIICTFVKLCKMLKY